MADKSVLCTRTYVSCRCWWPKSAYCDCGPPPPNCGGLYRTRSRAPDATFRTTVWVVSWINSVQSGIANCLCRIVRFQYREYIGSSRTGILIDDLLDIRFYPDAESLFCFVPDVNAIELANISFVDIFHIDECQRVQYVKNKKRQA